MRLVLKIALMAVLGFCVATLSAGSAVAQKRIALLVGNKTYPQSVGPLRNPHNDVDLVGKALVAVGFELMPAVRDATRERLLGAVYDFADKLKAAGPDAIGFFYYSGHGVGSGGQNYIIPVDVEQSSTRVLAIKGITHAEILNTLLEIAPLAMHYLVIDACRNNLGGWRGSKGFLPEQRRNGMMIAFAAAPGTTASDEGAYGGPYARALAAELVKPGQNDLLMFHNVRVSVDQETRGDQVPWIEDGIRRRERLHFGGDATAVAAPVPAQSAAGEAERAWSTVRDTNSIAVLEAFATQFGGTVYGALARARIEELKKERVAIAVPPVAPPVAPARLSWEPTQPISFLVPAGIGGAADQTARFIQGVVAKHNLAKQPILIVNKAGGAGAEGFLEMKRARGDPHKMILATSNLFTTPLATAVPFSWRDLTPVALLALEQFILWVPANAPYHDAKGYIEAVRAGGKSFLMGGTGSKQEDQVVTAALQRLTAPGALVYVPFAGGGTVATQLSQGLDSTVNKPAEAVAQWRAGAVRPLCMFDAERSKHTQKVTQTMAWSDIPACREAGVDVVYQMQRGIYLPGGAKPEHVAYYVDLMKRVVATADWQSMMRQGAFKEAFLSGGDFRSWIESNDGLHATLMREAGLVAPGR